MRDKMKKRRHHHVWQHYLKSWAVKGQLFCRMGGKIFPTSTVNIAQDRDFYKIERLSAGEIAYIKVLASKRAHPIAQQVHSEFLASITAPIESFERLRLIRNDAAHEELDRYLTNVLEDFHARIEARFLPLQQQITSGDISFYQDDAACVTFSNFVSVQYMRTKAVKERTMARLRQEKLPDLTRLWPFLSYLYSMNVGAALYLERKTRRLALLHNNTGVAFITGDQPMVNLLADGVTPPDALSIFYPISPVLALVLSDESKEPLFATETLTTTHIKKLNSRIVAASYSQIFGHSQEALLAL